MEQSGELPCAYFCRKRALQSSTFHDVCSRKIMPRRPDSREWVGENAGMFPNFGGSADLRAADQPCRPRISIPANPDQRARHTCARRARRSQLSESRSASESARHDPQLGRAHHSLPALSQQKRSRRSRRCHQPGVRPHQGLRDRASGKTVAS